MGNRYWLIVGSADQDIGCYTPLAAEQVLTLAGQAPLCRDGPPIDD